MEHALQPVNPYPNRFAIPQSSKGECYEIQKSGNDGKDHSFCR